MGHARFLLAGLAFGLAVAPAAADVFPRVGEARGSVISRRSGEEVRFVDDTAAWRGVEVSQGLLTGDTLRTNASGHLAILFSDNTQMRMGRNTELVVRQAKGADSQLELKSGAIWARALRGGSGLTIATPAAATSIRGTDWSLRVGAKGETTLSVLEGVVELANEQGSVTVRQGEGAVATIGQAPRKYRLVNLEEREQLLLYSEVRDVFSSLPVSPLKPQALRETRRRVLALPSERRSAEDWLDLAEAGLALDGRAAAKAALAALPARLPPRSRARAQVVEAMIAGQEMRYTDAQRLLAEAEPALSPERRAAAAYGRYFALSLAEPDRAAKAPRGRSASAGVVGILAEAALQAHADGPAAAIRIIEAAEPRFPDDVRLPVALANYAFELDRREAVRAALARARALDPANPELLLISARFRATTAGDLDGARAELAEAVREAPGADAAWNELAIVEQDRNATVEANAAYRRAIALNPENPALHANYARFLIDNHQMSAAAAEIAKAEAIDADSYAVLAAKGRYLLRLGRTDEGEQALLQASAVDPTYGDALVGLAIAAYQQESGEEAGQALDNADRFDRENPSVPLIRSAIALDRDEADAAIDLAREAARRRQARLGNYTGYDANRQVFSWLGVTLSNLGLNEWGQFQADRSIDPFIGTSYIDEAAEGRVSPFVGTDPLSPPEERSVAGATSTSSQLQGLLLDPMAAAGETRRSSLEGRSFFESTIGGGLIFEGDKPGWRTDLTLEGTRYEGLPLSYHFGLEIARPQGERLNDRNDVTGANLMLGMRPSLQDSLVLFANTGTFDSGFPGETSAPKLNDESRSRSSGAGAAWSHVIGERNVVQAFAVYGQVDTDDRYEVAPTDPAGVGPFDPQRFDPFVVDRDRLLDPSGYFIDNDGRDQSVTAGLGHLFGIGPITVHYGIEGSLYRSELQQRKVDPSDGSVLEAYDYSGDGGSLRLYGDALWTVNDQLSIEAGLHAVEIEDQDNCGCLDPRIGVAWAPFTNHWLRAYYREDTKSVSNYTLAPISTLGLSPLEQPLYLGGFTDTTGLRWDAEWSDRFFTSVDAQHQEIKGLAIGIPALLETFSAYAGTIDRVTASANFWLGHGIGAFASFTRNVTEDAAGDYGLPLIPDHVGQLGFTLVHPSRLRLTVAQTFVGPRVGGQAGVEIDGYQTTDASLRWTSESGHLEAGLQLLNAFDERFERALDVPGPGRTVIATLRARF
ncbi:FecR domain-containing protein [Rhizobium sp. YIM 134829]|uniref:FecR domain-containing protein n=1 Tax=Rhizobium sp. YIM 134829 TaxID=3390453 RepID=UPI00397E74BD